MVQRLRLPFRIGCPPKSLHYQFLQSTFYPLQTSRNQKFYLSPAYQEQEARRDFIDKFWLALGWDVNHETQKNPFEQEVKVERKEHGLLNTTNARNL